MCYYCVPYQQSSNKVIYMIFIANFITNKIIRNHALSQQQNNKAIRVMIEMLSYYHDRPHNYCFVIQRKTCLPKKKDEKNKQL